MLPSRPCVPLYLRPNYMFLTQPELTGFKEQTNYPVGAKRERNSSQSSGCHGHQGHFCCGRHLLTGRDLGQLEPRSLQVGMEKYRTAALDICFSYTPVILRLNIFLRESHGWPFRTAPCITAPSTGHVRETSGYSCV